METVPGAALQLQDVLARCKEKRQLLEGIHREISELEAQAQSLSYWIQTQDPLPEGAHASRALADLQSRLYDQLLPLIKGDVSILDCSASDEKSLAHHVRLTFEAFGWSVEFSRGSRGSHCGEEITFIVAPGPVSYSVAAIYMALQSSGIRLHSQIDLEQAEERALLCVHQISHVPKLLPPPKTPAAEKAVEDLKKSA
ncbi:MAG: hypothetical protein ABIT76_10465 [Chthoniobacterales bacterium]